MKHSPLGELQRELLGNIVSTMAWNRWLRH